MNIKAFLQEIPLFSGFSDDEFNMLEQVASEKTFAAGETILRKGDTDIALFLIYSGQAQVLLDMPEGKDIVLSTRKKGELLGEMSLFDGKPRSATVVAEDETTVVEITRQQFLDQIHQRPETAMKILAEMANRVRQVDDRVKDFAERVYREAYTKIDQVLTTQLDAAKTIYGRTEERSKETLEDAEKKLEAAQKQWVDLNARTEERAKETLKRAAEKLEAAEKTWTSMSRFIGILTGILTLLTVAMTYFGVTTVKEIADNMDSINQQVKQAESSANRIKEIEIISKKTVAAKDIVLSIGKIRQDMNLDEPANNDETEIRDLAIGFSRAKQILHDDFLAQPGSREPEVVLDAASTYVDLMDRLKTFASKQETHTKDTVSGQDQFSVVNALLTVIQQADAKDWRTRREARNLLTALGHGRGGWKENKVVDHLESAIKYQAHKATRENVALVLAKLGSHLEEAREILIGRIQDGKSISPWTQANAAIGLIQMGREEGWAFLSKRIDEKGAAGFIAAYKLAELGRVELDRLGLQQNLKIKNELDPATAVAERIENGIRFQDQDPTMTGLLNPYLEKHARILIKKLQLFTEVPRDQGVREVEKQDQGART